MALRYTVHNPAALRNGSPDSVATLPHVAGQSLAMDAPSATIVGPCELRLLPEEEIKLDVKALADAASLDSANSTLVLLIDVAERFSLGAGSWKIQATAVV